MQQHPPREATGGPSLPPTTDAPRSCATHTCPPYSLGPGVPTTEDRSSGKRARALTYSSSLSRPAGTRSGFLEPAHPPLLGGARAPPPPTGAQVAGGGTRLPVYPEGH